MRTILILVVGVTGVGKSTLCRLYTHQSESSTHLLASTFAKMVNGVDPNQTRLAASIRREVDRCSKTLALVDGHLIINGKRIPEEAIRILTPRGIVVVTDNPNEILKRRQFDKTKIRPMEETDIIKRNQAEEINFAQKLSTDLGMPLIVLKEASLESFNVAVREIYESTGPDDSPPPTITA